MFEKLDEIEKKYESLCHQLQNPEIIGDQYKLRQLMKKHSELKKIVTVFRQYKKLHQIIEDNKQFLVEEEDEELKALAREELNEAESSIFKVEQELKISLLPKDPNDQKNIILEIRPGAGGDEASLFAEQLFTAYTHYTSDLGFKIELLNFTAGNVGGAREIIAMISGNNVYSTLKYESGVHRVQRVPKTESQGRVHTSTVTVAVIPEVEEVEVKIDEKELRIDVMRASGAGGQHVNKTDSAVRITHNPTGLVVYCQEGKSQHINKDMGMKILLSRLRAMEEEKAAKKASRDRLSQIGTGDRSERIRTYNFPQNRITDHRIGLTLHCLDDIMKGHLAQVIDPVMAYYRAETLKRSESDEN